MNAGVGQVITKLASAMKPTIVISVDNDLWKLRTETMIKTQELLFKLGEEFDETTTDGRKVRVRIHVEVPQVCLGSPSTKKIDGRF